MFSNLIINLTNGLLQHIEFATEDLEATIHILKIALSRHIMKEDYASVEALHSQLFSFIVKNKKDLDAFEKKKTDINNKVSKINNLMS